MALLLVLDGDSRQAVKPLAYNESDYAALRRRSGLPIFEKIYSVSMFVKLSMSIKSLGVR